MAALADGTLVTGLWGVGKETGFVQRSTDEGLTWSAPIYLTEADVGRLVTVKDAIGVLEELFATWGQGATANLPRQRARLPGSL